MGSDEKQQEKRIEDFFVIQWLTGSGSIYRFFYVGGQANEKTESGRCPRWALRESWTKGFSGIRPVSHGTD